MPSGYLVQLGDYSLDTGDSIVGSLVTFTTDTNLGAGQWIWSGTWSGTTFTDEVEPGVFYLATDGNVYFVPDYGPVDTLTSSTALNPPSYVSTDGIVDGTAGDDLIDDSYIDGAGDAVDNGVDGGTSGNDDFVLAGDGNDTVNAGQGADTIYGGAGADQIDGGDGNDSIVGDEADTVSETLNWSDQGGDGTSLAGGFTQNTGEIDVSVSFENTGNNNPTFQVETSDTVYTDTGEDFDANSSLFLFGNGDGATSTTRINFAAATGSSALDEVGNVSFRISDIDWASGNHRDIVTINAYDSDGNLVTVTITPGSNDTVVGNTITAGDLGETSASASGSALIEIAGPVAEIEIIYENGLTGTQGINVSDLHFDVTLDVGEADSLVGGLGNDTIEGNGGDDTIIGGEGDDLLRGGTGNDSIQGLAGNDTLYGDHGNDTLEGGADNDLLSGGRGNDVLDGGTGADSLFGGRADDTLYVGQSDEAYGGSGDDIFIITDTGDTGTIIIDGGSEVTGGDILDLNGLGDRSTLNITDSDPNGPGLTGTIQLVDGTLVQFTDIESIICFTPGTRILTDQGERVVEDLRPGDMIITKDDGPQPLRWIGSRTVPGTGKLAPIAVTSEILPEAKRTLLVSPQHRFLMSGWRTELLFGEGEVLVSACHMTDDQGAFALPRSRVTYIHLMLDRHQIIYAEGVETESFHAADTGVSGMSDSTREEMFQVFPDLREDLANYGPTVRRCLRGHEARALMAANTGSAPCRTRVAPPRPALMPI